MSELNVQTFPSLCVVWKTKLPSIGHCYSPHFDIPSCYWYGLQFQIVYKDEHEQWSINLLIPPRITSDFQSSISIHLKNYNDYGFTAIFFGKLIQKSTYKSILNLRRLDLMNCGYLLSNTGYEVCLYFVFHCKSPSNILEEKPMQDIQPGKNALKDEADHSNAMLKSLKDFSKDIGKLFDEADHSNAMLKCEDRCFSVNKHILSARSDVFAAMFRNKMSESDSGFVNVEDMDSNRMEQFLRFVYSGRLDSLCADSALDLYKAGDKYAVESLKQECASFMVDHLSEETVCEVLLLAHTFGDVELLKSAVSFAVDRAQFLKSEGWKTFAKSNQTVAMEVYMKYVEK